MYRLVDRGWVSLDAAREQPLDVTMEANDVLSAVLAWEAKQNARGGR